MTNKFLAESSIESSQIAIELIIDMLVLLDRPELRSKFLQEYNRINIYLSKLNDISNINQDTLEDTQAKIQTIIETLNRKTGKFVDHLRNLPFIKAITQQAKLPGGTCIFNTPSLHTWLIQPYAARKATLEEWFSQFNDVQHIIYNLLNIVRNSATKEHCKAIIGYYQKTLDPVYPCQLIRVGVAASDKVYPSISVGRHGLSIQFLNLSLSAEAKKTQNNIDFSLECCLI